MANPISLLLTGGRRGAPAMIVAALVGAAPVQGGADYALPWSSIDAGGGRLVGGSMEVAGTIGQPDAATLTGGGMILCGGFQCGAGGPGETFCPGDITGPGSVPDGNIDAVDFLIVIEQWGSTCPCQADVAGPGTDRPDGNVDVFDFLRVIAYWGSPASCP